MAFSTPISEWSALISAHAVVALAMSAGLGSTQPDGFMSVPQCHVVIGHGGMYCGSAPGGTVVGHAVVVVVLGP